MTVDEPTNDDDDSDNVPLRDILARRDAEEYSALDDDCLDDDEAADLTLANTRQKRRRNRTISTYTRIGKQLSAVDGDDLCALNAQSLRTIKLNDNMLTELPELIGRFENLEILMAADNNLTLLPHSIWRLQRLISVDFSCNELIRLPRTIDQAKSLQVFRIRNNRLTSLPREINGLPSLLELDVANNVLLSLPEMSNLKGLQFLDASNNSFERFPAATLSIESLATLHLERNHIKKIPNEVRRLKQLKHLNLSNNELTSLSSSLGDLRNLEVLDLRFNCLETLPRELGNLRDTVLLLLDGNPLIEPLRALSSRGTRAVMSYLRSLDEATPQYEAKLLLVGEGNVGKSSLLASLRGEQFDEKRLTTHGIELGQLHLPHPNIHTKIQLNTWDFGGQPLYRVTHQFFLSRRALYLAVWKPREGVEENQIENWVRRILLRVGTEARIMIVATHVDERRPEFDYESLAKKYPDVLVGNFGVSNKTGRGIDELRCAIAVQSANLPQMGEELSVRWAEARTEITTMPHAFITRAKLERVCASRGLNEEATVTFGNLLHDLGYIIHYSEDNGLRDIVVLKPEWLTKAIGFVLEDEHTRDAGGLLEHNHLRTIWTHPPEGEEAYSDEHYPYFLRLMEKFEVSYRLPGQSSSLVAQLLPYSKPRIPWVMSARSRNLRTICRLSDEAYGLIPWLTVRNSRFSTGVHWRRGVYLEHSMYATRALLELAINNRDLQINVIGPSPDYFFHVLKDGVEELIGQRWPGLNYDFLVPCGQVDKVTQRRCSGYFRYHTLATFHARNETNIICQTCVQWNDVLSLLTGHDSNRRSLQDLLEDLRQSQLQAAESLSRIEERASESAHHIRIALKLLSSEITDCPRLFTLQTENQAAVLRALSVRHHFKLTLWCEEPGREHPIQDAVYRMYPSKEWLVAVAPYLRFVVGMLKVAVPLSAAALPLGISDEAYRKVKDELEFSKVLADKIPQLSGESKSALSIETQSANLAEGAGLRALRQLLFESIDRPRAFGGMRRFTTPAGDFLWICPNHSSQYDPGLPSI